MCIGGNSDLLFPNTTMHSHATGLSCSTVNCSQTNEPHTLRRQRDEGEDPTRQWYCHCCNQCNEGKARVCRTCGRPDVYGTLVNAHETADTSPKASLATCLAARDARTPTGFSKLSREDTLGCVSHSILYVSTQSPTSITRSSGIWLRACAPSKRNSYWRSEASTSTPPTRCGVKGLDVAPTVAWLTLVADEKSLQTILDNRSFPNDSTRLSWENNPIPFDPPRMVPRGSSHREMMARIDLQLGCLAFTPAQLRTRTKRTPEGASRSWDSRAAGALDPLSCGFHVWERAPAASAPRKGRPDRGTNHGGPGILQVYRPPAVRCATFRIALPFLGRVLRAHLRCLCLDSRPGGFSLLS